jgi:hypothetical protein
MIQLRGMRERGWEEESLEGREQSGSEPSHENDRFEKKQKLNEYMNLQIISHG